MIHVIGASGRSGAALCRALAADGRPYVPVVRNAARWRATGLPGEPAIADLERPDLTAALAGATTIVSCAHARHTASILAASPPAATLIALGSTRKYTRWPDAHGDGVLAGERALLAAGRPAVMLHPTMIYGAEGEDNVQRLAALLRRLPVLPLPGGGRALVQPIYQADLTRCLLAAIDRPWPKPEAIVVAGPDPLTYADFVRAVAHAAGLPPSRIVSVPAVLLLALTPLTLLPLLPRVRAAEIRRMLEDKAFSTATMQDRLGVRPISIADGLARTFAPRHARVAGT